MLTLDSNCCTAGVHVHSNRLVQAVIFLSLLRVGMCVCGGVGRVGGGGGTSVFFCGGWGFVLASVNKNPN